MKARDLMAPDTEPTDEELELVMREARDLAVVQKAISDAWIAARLKEASEFARVNAQPRSPMTTKSNPVPAPALSLPPLGLTLKVMQASSSGFPEPAAPDESPAQALVRLLEQHGLEDSLREILAAIESRKLEEQKKARLALLEYLLEGQPPLTEAELAAVRDE